MRAVAQTTEDADSIEQVVEMLREICFVDTAAVDYDIDYESGIVQNGIYEVEVHVDIPRSSESIHLQRNISVDDHILPTPLEEEGTRLQYLVAMLAEGHI